jgi:hypothetical protein
LFITAVAGAGIVATAPWAISSVTDDASKATIVAAYVTLLGVIFTAVLSEVSSYYQEQSANVSKKRDLIFPLLQKDYFPIIHAGEGLLKAMRKLPKQTAQSQEEVMHLYWLTSVLFGLQMKFTINDGGVVLLSSTEDEDRVVAAFNAFEDVFLWAEDKTAPITAQLDKVFLAKEKSGDPFVPEDLRNAMKGDVDLRDGFEQMKKWCSDPKKVERATEALDAFTSRFKESVNRLYAAWW